MRFLTAPAIALVLATPVALASASAERTVAARDKAGDVKPGDLDILRASLTRRNGLIVAKISVAKPIGTDVIFAVYLATGSSQHQLGAKRAAGTTTFFVFRLYPNSRQHPATGSFSGRTVTITARASRMGLERAAFRFYFVAEGANTRPAEGDRLPDDNRPVLEQLEKPLAKTLRFPRN